MGCRIDWVIVSVVQTVSSCILKLLAKYQGFLLTSYLPLYLCFIKLWSWQEIIVETITQQVLQASFRYIGTFHLSMQFWQNNFDFWVQQVYCLMRSEIYKNIYGSTDSKSYQLQLPCFLWWQNDKPSHLLLLPWKKIILE